jgi:hypothetical protein
MQDNLNNNFNSEQNINEEHEENDMDIRRREIQARRRKLWTSLMCVTEGSSSLSSDDDGSSSCSLGERSERKEGRIL